MPKANKSRDGAPCQSAGRQVVQSVRRKGLEHDAARLVFIGATWAKTPVRKPG
jgi:hypothetical protein